MRGELKVTLARMFSIDLGALENSVVEIPSRTVLGLGLSDPFHWFIGAEYTTQDMSAFRNEFVEPSNSSYEQASMLSVGGYYIPKYNALNGILNRVTYRAGLRFEDTGLRVNQIPIECGEITFVSSICGAFKFNFIMKNTLPSEPPLNARHPDGIIKFACHLLIQFLYQSARLSSLLHPSNQVNFH